MWLWLALWGCEPEVECTTEAVASVSVTVAGLDGGEIPGAVASWEQPGGELAPCDDLGEGRFACGWEVKGRIEVYVEAPGYVDWYWQGDIAEDAAGCHVEPIALTAELTPVGCEERPPVVRAVVSAADAAGEVPGALVSFRPAGNE